MSNKTNLVQRPLLRYGCFQRLRHSSSSLTIIREADDCPRNMLHTLPQTKGVELCRLKHHYDSILRYDLMQKLIIQNTHQTPKLEKIILSSSVSYKPQQVRGLENIAAKNSGDGVGKGALETLTPQVKKALILLSGQSLSAKTFRVARPHLGIRKGKLAAYQVTLRNEGMYFFIERLLTEILPKVIRIDKAVLTSGSNSSNRHLHKNLLKLANFELLVDEDGSPAKKAAWLNDQPSAQDDTIKSFFDGQGNFQIGIPDFYLFREIEQNIEFTKLNGLNVSIVTSARTDYEARLLLSGFQAPWC